MKIPKKIKIGGHIYRVFFVKTRDEKKQSCNIGLTNAIIKKIYVEKDIPRSQQENTFLHEVLHAIMMETRLWYDFDRTDRKLDEEDIVGRMANMLYQVLKDNKLMK